MFFYGSIARKTDGGSGQVWLNWITKGDFIVNIDFRMCFPEGYRIPTRLSAVKIFSCPFGDI